MASAVGRIWIVRLLSIAWRRFGEDNCFALSGYLAYTGLLSFFPFMVFLVMSGSLLVGPDASLMVTDAMFALAPDQVSGALKPSFLQIIEDKSGVAALIAAGVGLWAGSNAFEAARIGFNLAYDVREDRAFLRRRAQSLTLAAAAAIVFVTLAFLIVLWPTIANLVEVRAPAGEAQALGFDVFYYARYAIGLPMFCILLVVLHTRLPRGRGGWTRIHVHTEHDEEWTISVIPGVIATTFIWFVGATLFSLYLRYAPSMAGSYGAMAGVVITLLFFYMSSVVIFLGAQINIAREEIRRGRDIRGGPLIEDASDEAGEAAEARRVERREAQRQQRLERAALDRAGP